MGTTLTGKLIADTYDALLKVTDNNVITGIKKRMTDGFGNDTPLLISTTDVQVDGNFLTESVQFNTATLQTANAVGKLAWNDNDGTLDLRLKGNNVTLQIGQEQVVRVVNKTGSNLLEANYQVVKLNGAQGNRLKVALAQANNDANSAETLGLVTETINDNQEGFVTTSGLVRGINTTGSLQGETWADGDMLYLSGTTAGRLTNIKPSAPTHTVIMGYVVRSHATQGQIFVKVDNGYELDELHNVSISSPTNGQVLAYESATGLWKNTTNGNGTVTSVSGTGTVSGLTLTGTVTSSGSLTLGGSLTLTSGDVTSGLGYTPVPNTRSLTINGTAYDLSADRSWSVGTVTSVGLSVPTGFAVSNSPVTGSGTLGLSFAAGYSLPTNLSQASWDTAFSSRIATFTTTGNSGAATFSSNTLNIPNYTLSGLGGVPTTRTLTINGTSYDLSADRSWTISTGLSGSGTTNYIPKFTGSTSLGNSLIFDNGTNVGISKTSPTNPLHIGTGANSILLDGVKVDRDPSTTSSAIFNAFGGGANIISNGGATSSFPPIIFSSSDGTTTNERVRITGAGNVGIGTSSPNSLYSLTLTGNASSITGGIVFRQNTTDTLYIGNPATSNTADIEIWNPRNGYLRFATNNAEAIRITSSGNIGIGTTAPAARLDVSVGQEVNGYSLSGYPFLKYSAGDVLDYGAFGATWTALRFLTNGSERMRITSAGNVGIGTTSPVSLLTIKGSSNYNGVVTIDSTGAVGGGAISLSQNGVQSGFLTVTGVALGTSGRDLAYYANAGLGHVFYTNDGSERMRITSSGAVGIGTSNPNTQLHVVGSLTVNDIVYLQRSSSSLFLPIANYWNGSGSPLAGTKGDILAIGNAGGDGLALVNSNAVRMFINSSGNVGIGTSSPARTLDINGTIAWGASSGRYMYAGGTSHIFAYSDSNLNLLYSGGSGGFGINNAADSARIFQVTDAGNVGIGTFSPAYRLHVVGPNPGAAALFTNASNADLAIDLTSGVSLISPTTGTLALGTSSTERMRITSGGNVGLNTSSPSYRLDVNGDIRSTGVIRVNTGTIDTVMTFDTGAGAIGTLTNHNLNFWINGTAQAKITTGNQFYVGTGVVDGSAKVQIDSTTQGFLPPRMTSLQRIAIATPAVGLIVYQTDNAGGLGGNEGLYVYKSGGWTFII